MHLTSTSLGDGQRFDHAFVFCQPSAEGHTTDGGNRSPHLAWGDAPGGTRSFAVVVRDPDVPADASDANTKGKTIPADAARVDFFHWLLVDVPASVSEITEGVASDGVTAGGKAPGRTVLGLEGTNTFTDFLKGSPREGTYGRYDGPCPPWNDERLHHYHVTVYALDVPTLGLPEDGSFTGADVLAAIEGHVLGQAEIVGTYSTNPDVR